MIQVMRVLGQARFSAFRTGSTCTASPNALSMTMSTSRGGVAKRSSGTESAFQLEPDAVRHALARFALPLVQRSHEAHVHTVHVPPRCAIAQRAAIEIDHPGAAARDQDV